MDTGSPPPPCLLQSAPAPRLLGLLRCHGAGSRPASHWLQHALHAAYRPVPGHSRVVLFNPHCERAPRFCLFSSERLGALALPAPPAASLERRCKFKGLVTPAAPPGVPAWSQSAGCAPDTAAHWTTRSGTAGIPGRLAFHPSGCLPTRSAPHLSPGVPARTGPGPFSVTSPCRPCRPCRHRTAGTRSHRFLDSAPRPAPRASHSLASIYTQGRRRGDTIARGRPAPPQHVHVCTSTSRTWSPPGAVRSHYATGR